MTDTKLKSFVDRIESVEGDQRDRGADKREIYDEAKDAGYNTKALRKLIAERRQKDREEIADAMDGYRLALGMAGQSVRDGMSLDEAHEEYGFSRSAIHRASHCEENAASGTKRDDIPEACVWLAVLAAREAFEAAREAERQAAIALRRAEREARDKRNAAIDADPLTIPSFLKAKKQVAEASVSPERSEAVHA